MRLDELKPAPGSKHRRKIVGRGIGSGHGAQSTRGMKGQRSRSGFGGMAGFEGGQIPLIRRIPKRGFRHTMFDVDRAVINVGSLEINFEANAEVTPQTLHAKKLIKKGQQVKILSTGDLKKSLIVKAHAFSASAQEKIQKAGGKAEILPR
jgi:large subunit ribosomal protein L15